MKKTSLMVVAAHCLLLCAGLHSEAEPFDGSTFKGRIALSHDGNYNDEDDWGSLPVAIAILDAMGLKDKVVHVDYNNIVRYNDPRFEKEMTVSALGAAEQFGFPASVFHNDRTDLAGAVASIKNAINASSRDNPLYFIPAGPLDVPGRGILAADPAKRQYVYCVSHNQWNDGYATPRIQEFNKRDLIPLGVKWIQVKDGNRLLAHSGAIGTKSTPAQWGLYQWLQDSSDTRLKWIHTRLEAEGRCDISDSTMHYFLVTGDEECNLQKLAALLDKKQKPTPLAIRPLIRMEAENFGVLENYTAAERGASSHHLCVRMSNGSKGLIRTEFYEPYSAFSGRYNVGVRYRGEGGGTTTFALRVNNALQGENWKVSANEKAWKTQTIKNISISAGDEIAIEVTSDGNGRGELDYVELNYLGPASTAVRPSQTKTR